jgi:hypothetical protein
MRLTPPAVVIASIVLLLAGCSAPTAAGASGSSTAPESASTSAPPASAPSAPSAAPTVDPTDAINATTVLPDDFPPVIPLINGDILTASSTDDGWDVWISSSDPIDDYGQASSSLQDAGFTAIADQSINGSAGGVFENDQYSITVTAGADAKYPDAVGYEIVKK